MKKFDLSNNEAMKSTRTERGTKLNFDVVGVFPLQRDTKVKSFDELTGRENSLPNRVLGKQRTVQMGCRGQWHVFDRDDMDCAVSMAWHSQNSQDLGNANRRIQDKPVLILSESSQFSLLQQRNIVKPRENE